MDVTKSSVGQRARWKNRHLGLCLPLLDARSTGGSGTNGTGAVGTGGAAGIAAHNATISITGAVQLDTGSGNAAIFTDNGTINTGGFTATAANIVESLNGVAPVAPGLLISSGAISVAVPGSILTRTRFQSAGAASFTANTALTIGGATTGGPLTLAAAGDIEGGDIVTAGLFEVITPGNLTFGTVRAESDIDLTAGGNVTTGALSAGDSVLIGVNGSVTTGNIDAGVLRPTSDPEAGFGVGIQAAGNVTTGTINARGPVGLGSDTGSVTAGAIQTQDSLLVLARTGATLGAITTAPDGTTYIANSSMLSLLDPVTLDPAPIFAANPVAIAGPVTIGGAVATNRLAVASTGTATFNGPVSASTISVRSGDLAIGSGGGLGSAATQTLDLIVDPLATAVAFGGADAPGGYSLSGDEAGRLRAQSISFTVQASASRPAPQLTLGGFTMRGGGAGQAANLAGTQGRLRIVTPGAIAVTGAALVTDAVAGNLVDIVAGGRIEINSAAGAIRLTNGTAPAGALRLAASDIWAADAALLSALRDNVDFAGRDARLGQPSTVRDAPAVLAGGSVTLTADDTILIANTGDFRTRAGIDAGAGGITVAARVAAPRPGQQSPTADLPAGTIDVVINGQAVDAAGLLLTNRRTIDAFTVASGTTLTPTASVNGCVIATAICAGSQGDPVTVAAVQASVEPQQLTEQAEQERKEAEEAVSAADKRPNAVISRLIDGAGISNDDVIDDPVSGGGNTSLWETTPTGEPR